MSDKTALGDRMKSYEAMEASRRAMPLLPVMVRIDGKCFSSWTKGMDRPYDKNMSLLMSTVTEYLVEESGAILGYTQSDEISLILYAESSKTELFMGGKIQKLTSVLASMATARFNYLSSESYFPEKRHNPALFDCRVWTVPNKTEAANTILWRERDASKNSLSMAAAHYYSHNQLMGKHSSEKHDMLHAKGVNWNDYPTFFKRGVFIRRKIVDTPFTADELATLPEKHEAHKNPDLVISRSVIEAVDVPPFDSVTNRVGFIFDGEDAVTCPNGKRMDGVE